ncbi:uncharacterized protein LOC124303898 [Neodiprion virginianus]|uniref:uncharacterized protein LOC124303898 n=1 Tax=Neodiprion virginianus TaxID=2961670 RepID=UPI001EE74570|nr:uncharacterized protein LOC124303898 [Neodiprion virginianus]
MALVKQTGPLPTDAVPLNKNEALRYQVDMLRHWPNQLEVWPLRSGIGILSITAAVAGIYVNAHYRRKMKLMKIGSAATYLPIIVLPGIAATFAHKLFVTRDILLERKKCLLCLETRAALLQFTVGFLYPMTLGPMGSVLLATRYATYRLPNITNDFWGLISVLRKFTRPINLQLSIIAIGQLFLGLCMTRLEIKSYYNVKQQLLEAEKVYDNSPFV